jgi:uncharacterized membrane protein
MSEPHDPTTPGPPSGTTPPPPPPPEPGGYAPPPPGYPPPAPPGSGGFSVGNAIGWGWKKFQQNIGPLVIVALAILGVLVVIAILQAIADNNFLSLLLSLIELVVNVVISAGIVKAALEVTAGRPIELGTMFKGYSIPQLVIAALLTTLFIMLGLIALIIGAIVVAFFLSFTTYYIVDQGQAAWDAIKSSFNFTKTHAGDLVLLFLAIIGLNIVGACLCGVGLLVTIPVTILAQAYAFRMLNNQPVVP